MGRSPLLHGRRPPGAGDSTGDGLRPVWPGPDSGPQGCGHDLLRPGQHRVVVSPLYKAPSSDRRPGRIPVVPHPESVESMHR